MGGAKRKMHIIAVGLNYQTAPVEIREKVSFNEAELANAMEALKNKKSILENVIVSTCNRTEILQLVINSIRADIILKNFFLNGSVLIRKNSRNIFLSMKVTGQLNIYFK